MFDDVSSYISNPEFTLWSHHLHEDRKWILYDDFLVKFEKKDTYTCFQKELIDISRTLKEEKALGKFDTRRK